MIRQRYIKNDHRTATTFEQVDPGLTDHGTNNNHPSISCLPTRDADDRKSYFHCYRYCYAIFHILSLFFIIIGIPLTYQNLYTHVECDMTWSQREFIRIDIARYDDSHPAAVMYQFYKFIDQRDPRYRNIQGKSVLYATDSTSWCSSTSTDSMIVLYVPGHGGNYQQSRSLGAHGIQMTHRNMEQLTQQSIIQQLSTFQQRDKGTTNSINGTTTIDNFFFDVYAFDFNEEGGAFHGAILERQATYIVNVIQKLIELCPSSSTSSSLSIVAHSIGGISTRLAVRQLHDLNITTIQNVITLGTPHYMPVWNWGTSMHNVYNRLYSTASNVRPKIVDNNNNNNDSSASTSTSTMISISGGLRDEMIPPKACYIGDDDDDVEANALTLLTTDIMIRPRIEGKEYLPPFIGVDHRAIVWCHNVVSQVRYILYSLTHHQFDRMKSNRPNSRFIRTNELHKELFGLSSSSSQRLSYDYLQSVSNLQQSLKKKYGWFTAFVMETSFLYNTEILVTLYAMIGAVRYLGLDISNVISPPIMSVLLPPVACTILSCWMSFHGKWKHTISIQSMVILTFVADAIYVSTRYLLRRYVVGSLHYRKRTSSHRVVVTTSLTFTILTLAAFYIALGSKLWHQLQLIIGVTMIVMVVFLSLFLIAVTPKEPIRKSQVLHYRRQLNYIVLLLWMLPFIIIGDIYAIVKGIYTWGVYKLLSPIILRLVLAIYSESRVTSLRPSIVPMVKQIDMLQLCRSIAIPLCFWRLITLDVHHYVVLHPLPTLIFVATATDILEDGLNLMLSLYYRYSEEVSYL